MKLRPPKRIIISHVYSSDNKGDAALTSILIKDLKKQFPKAVITISKLEAPQGQGIFEGVREYPAFMHYALNKPGGPLAKLIYTLYMIPATLAWAAWFKATGRHLYLAPELRRIAVTYAAADLIVAVGGGYIRSRKGLANRWNIPLLLHPLLFGHILGKPTVLYSQSIGPFVHSYEPALVTFVLRRMTLILLREDTSVALATKLGLTENVQRAIDSGFLLTSTAKLDVHKTYGIPPGKTLLGVTVRDWLRGDAQANYERHVAAALDTIIKDLGVHVLFIPQVTASKGDDDRQVSRRVYSHMTQITAATVINSSPNHHRIKAIYDGLDALLGTRFHSVIFSLTSYVPVLAIEYEHKTSGIMRDLNLQRWVIKIEEATSEKLTTGLRALMRDTRGYRAHLHKQIPPYLRRAEQASAMIAKVYYDER